MRATYPCEISFNLDGRKRGAVLKAASAMGLTVIPSEGLTFLVTVASPMEAYQFGKRTVQCAAEAGVRLDQADTPVPKVIDGA